MHKSQRFLVPVIVLLGFAFTTFAQKEQNKIRRLSIGADVILTGKVEGKKSSWNQNKTRIYTKATLKVDEYLKGNQNRQSIEVLYPGGEVGEVGELYTHMPKFELAEEVLVFLKKDHSGKSFKVYDGENGKIPVFLDEQTRNKVTASDGSLNSLKKEIKSILRQQ